MLQGSGGVFEVTRDGTLLFSKRKAGRHAGPGEILGLLEQSEAPR